jgi:hypothetical protein
LYEDILRLMFFRVEIECCINYNNKDKPFSVTQETDFPKMINNDKYSPMHFYDSGKPKFMEK